MEDNSPNYVAEGEDWQKVLSEHANIPPDGYVLYLRRSLKQKKKKGEEETDEREERQSRIDMISIQQQRLACMYEAKQRKIQIVAEFWEEQTAKEPRKREEFKRMLAYLREHKNLGVFAWAPDRLSRNALEAGELIHMFVEKEIMDFQFVTYHFHQDESGLEYLMMEFARAMGYSLRHRKNVIRGMRSKYHENQEWMFPEKFGYKRLLITDPRTGKRDTVNFLIPHEGKDGKMGEFEAIQLAFTLRKTGMFLDQIAAEISRVGYVTKDGKKGKMTKAKLGRQGKGKAGYLQDTFYYGMADSEWGPIDLRGQKHRDDEGNILEFTPVISETEFQECQRFSDERRKVQTKKHTDVPFRQFIFCGHCEEPLRPQPKKGKIYYYCMNTACSGRAMHSQNRNKEVKNGITGEDLYDAIGTILRKGFKLTQRELTAYLLHLEKRNQLRRHIKSRDLKAIAAQKGHITLEMEKADKELMASLADENVDMKGKKRFVALHKATMNELEHRMKLTEKREQNIKSQDVAWTQELSEWLELMQNGFSYWKEATLDEKREIAEIIFLELTVENGNLASYEYTEPYQTCEKVNLSVNGGQYWT